MNKDLLVVALVVVLVGLAWVVVLNPPEVRVERTEVERVIGASSGQDQYFPQRFYEKLDAARIINGGTVLAIGSATSSAPSVAQICNNIGATITMTASSGAFTIPESADMYSGCLTENGKNIFFFVDNQGTATTSLVITAASASTTVVTPEATVPGDSDLIDGGTVGWLKFVRVSATKMIVFVTKFVDSD